MRAASIRRTVTIDLRREIRVINDPTPSEKESIRLDLEASKGDIGPLLDVLRRLVELRRRGALALDLERELGRRLLGKGEPLLACGAVTGALRAQREKPGDPRLRQLRGLALARLGETRRACRELGALAREPHDDPRLIEETFGILARSYKDLGFEYRATNPASARKYWRRSFRHYNGVYAKTGSYYSGINAATLSLLLGSPQRARRWRSGCSVIAWSAGKPPRLVIGAPATTSTGWRQPWARPP